MRRSGMTIEIKTPEQIAVMREAGLVVARTLRVLAAAVRPGITTADLDALAEAEIRAAGGTGSFKGYYDYPATICTSVNEEIVHGIPSPQRSLREGDIVSIDCGAIVNGWHGDAAVTVGVGAISAEHAELLQACETALWRGLAQAQAGGRLGDISCAVETSVGASGRYGIVQEYTGHGIGSAMHMDPPVPNYGRAGRGCGRAWRWPSSRWSCSAARRRCCSTTGGRSSPPTEAGPRTSSTRSRSPPMGRGY